VLRGDLPFERVVVGLLRSWDVIRLGSVVIERRVMRLRPSVIVFARGVGVLPRWIAVLIRGTVILIQLSVVLVQRSAAGVRDRRASIRSHHRAHVQLRGLLHEVRRELPARVGMLGKGYLRIVHGDSDVLRLDRAGSIDWWRGVLRSVGTLSRVEAGVERLPLLASDLDRIRAPQALQLQMLADGVVEQSHCADKRYWAEIVKIVPAHIRRSARDDYTSLRRARLLDLSTGL
jgi:hypothetical protein